MIRAVRRGATAAVEVIAFLLTFNAVIDGVAAAAHRLSRHHWPERSFNLWTGLSECRRCKGEAAPSIARAVVEAAGLPAAPPPARRRRWFRGGTVR